MPSDSSIGNEIVEICFLLWSRVSPYRACTWRLACQHFDFNSTNILALRQSALELQLVFANKGKDFLKPLFLADVRGVGTRDEPPRASTCEANSLVRILFTCCK